MAFGYLQSVRGMGTGRANTTLVKSDSSNSSRPFLPDGLDVVQRGDGAGCDIGVHQNNGLVSRVAAVLPHAIIYIRVAVSEVAAEPGVSQLYIGDEIAERFVERRDGRSKLHVG